MHHKLTAVKVSERHGEITVSAMTRSPRGTQIAFKQLTVGKRGTDKKAFRAKLEAAIDKLYEEAQE